MRKVYQQSEIKVLPAAEEVLNNKDTEYSDTKPSCPAVCRAKRQAEGYIRRPEMEAAGPAAGVYR